MGSALLYLVNRVFYRIGEFFRHWYKDGFYFFFRGLINFLERLDRYFALRVTFRYLFQPLYQNYNFIGYALGFIFRGIRLLMGGFVYGLVILIWTGFYSAWVIIPIAILIKIMR